MCICSLQFGNTVLHEACCHGNVDMVSALLSSGIPVDIRNNVSKLVHCIYVTMYTFMCVVYL